MDPYKSTVVYGPEAVAKHFAVTVRTVQLWVKKGMPKSGKRYDLVECELWRRRQQEQEDTAAELQDPENQEEGGNKAFWSRREIKAKAELRELELVRIRGELIERREVEQLFIARILATKNGLLSLARALPPQLVHCKNEREMEIIIGQAVRELLEAFSRPLPETITTAAKPEDGNNPGEPQG